MHKKKYNHEGLHFGAGSGRLKFLVLLFVHDAKIWVGPYLFNQTKTKMLQMLKTKIDGDLVTALEAASKNIVTKNLLMPCSISDGYLVFPKSRIKSKKVLKHLINTGRVELV